MVQKRLSNVIGFDDAPFPRRHRGEVTVVGAVFAGSRFDGVVVGEIQKDGFDAAEKLEKLISASKFRDHAQLIMLQGITLGGFNVVDVFYLHRRLALPVLVVSRKQPDMPSVKKALISHIPEGKEKWALIEKLGPMERVGKVHVQRAGLTFNQAASVIEQFSIHSHIPEPLRAAHLIASAIAEGQSRGNP